MSTTAGTASSFWRYPVKSMLGEEVAQATFGAGAGGLDGDRAYAVVDDETGKVVSVKRPKRWGRMFELAASTGPDGVLVEFPDGRRFGIDDAALVEALTTSFGRPVSIASVPSPDATFDEVWMSELKDGVDPYFDLPTRTEGDEAGLIDAGQFMGPAGNFFNFGAVHLVTTGTTRRLAELAPGVGFEPRRFRPNVVVETDGDGFVETGWQGRELAIGEVRLSVSFTVPRCVMTTLEQGDLPADPDVLRAITRHNAVDCFGLGTTYPCVGVYADVTVPGTVEPGEAVVLL